MLQFSTGTVIAAADAGEGGVAGDGDAAGDGTEIAGGTLGGAAAPSEGAAGAVRLWALGGTMMGPPSGGIPPASPVAASIEVI